MMKADRAEIEKALALLVEPGAVVELRILNTRSRTVSGYFDDLGKLAQAAADWSGRAPGVYVTLNPVDPALLARAANRLKGLAKQTTADRDILRRRWLPIDFDAGCPSGISSTDEEHLAALGRAREAREWLQAEGWPHLMLGDSGNGAHLLALVDLPNDDASRRLVERCLHTLDLRFSDNRVKIDVTVGNAARIWKLYGTLAAKGDNTADRPHRLARVLEVPDQLVPVPRDLLERLAAMATLPGAHRPGAMHEQDFDLEAWLDEHADRLHVVTRGPWNGGQKFVLNPCPWNPDHTNRAAYVLQFASGAIAAGCHHNGCAGKDWRALRELVEPGWRARRRGEDTERQAAPGGDAAGRAEMRGGRPRDLLVILEGLESNPAHEVLGARLRAFREMLKGADPLDRAVLRDSLIHRLEALGVRSPAMLADAALAADQAREDLRGRPLALADPEPWPEPVDIHGLLGEIACAFRRFLVLVEGAAVAVALWIIHAHSHEVAEVSPNLTVTSPVRRCGKTLFLSVLAPLVPRPLFSSNVTPAVVFRAVEKHRPTLLIDEADTFLTLSDEMRGLLNAGHSRQAAIVIRTVGDDHEARTFSTWCPKAIALIGKLPDTLADRSIEIPMRRRAPAEDVERFRQRKLGELASVCRRATRWAKDHLDELGAADPQVPDGLDDRAADNWRPLLAIADLAGGDWPAKAREAARLLSGGERKADTAAGVQLLADIRDVFTARATDKLTSASLVEDLVKLEERPWKEWGKREKAITQRQLAVLLKPFGIAPRTIREGDDTPRGYERGQFDDAFSHYLPPHDPKHQQQANDDAWLPGKNDPQQDLVVADGKVALTARVDSDVLDVADREPAEEEGWGEV